MTDEERRHRGPAAGEVPNEAEAERAFRRGTGAPLKDQQPMYDEHGTDIRTYTGEPVETEDGWVIPEQSVAGSQRVVGGGEFPSGDDRGVDASTADDERDVDGG